MGIRQWLILSTLSILSSLGVFAHLAWAQTRQIDLTPSSRSNQTVETKEIELTLSSKSNQNFAALMQQAEFLAKSSIEQGFAESSEITEISVSILGERSGLQAPLLFSRVSRSDWQKQPKIQKWTRYFGSSAVLLGFSKPQVQQSTSAPSPDTSEQSTSVPSPDTSEQSTSVPSPGTSEQSTSVPSPGTSIPQSPAAPSPGTSIPTGADREESDPGFR